MGKAAEAFDKLPFQDIVSWNSVITACGSQECSESALQYFEQMVSEGVAPDIITFTGVLKACGNIGSTTEGRKAHVEMEIRGLVENELAGSALMSMYAKCGLNSEARRVFDRLRFRDVITWTALLAGHAQIGESELVISNFEQMLVEEIEPDSIAFFVVLSACSDVCSVHRCHTYLECMSKQYGIIPTHEHYSCLVHLHGHVGELESAFLMAKKMPAFPNRSLLHALLDASKRSGNSDIGQQVFESTVYFV
jgi:pentatricopeptide repeat protein